MTSKILAQGAEAIITLVKNEENPVGKEKFSPVVLPSASFCEAKNQSINERNSVRQIRETSSNELTRYILKDRISKSYRFKELDDKIRKQRTLKEARILHKAKEIINVPKVFNANRKGEANSNFQIEMEFIEGDKLSEHLNNYHHEKQFEVMKELGKEVAKLHKENIIHGDLTTSNTILKDKKIFIIDFGLGFISHRLEDRAVDLHLIKQALEAKHFQNWEGLFENFLKGYTEYDKHKEVLEQLKKVEGRGRYRH
jgi:TP53 regulating kinase-like protein